MPDIHDTLNERGTRYGDFTEHAVISEELLQIVMSGTGEALRPSWQKMAPFQRQALRTILDKIARICNGDPHYDDNWRDISGYATLVLDRLTKGPEPDGTVR